MKRILVVMDVLTVFAFAACQVVAQPATEEATVPYPTSSIISVVPSTATETILPTETPELTITASSTVPVTATGTSIDPVLREQGYDIADVRFSFPREDTLVVDFKYRLEESRKSKRTFILISFPQECRDDFYDGVPPRYLTRDVLGEGQITFKMTLQGVCASDSMEFTLYPEENLETNPPFYSEYVLQPYRLVRDFPTLNSDTLKIEDFQLRADANWKGLFTFNYTLSEEIPLPLEQYGIYLYGFGPDGACNFGAWGGVLDQHTGKFSIGIDLRRDLGRLQNCLDGRDHYTFTTTYISVEDMLVRRTVYHQAVDLQLTFVE